MKKYLYFDVDMTNFCDDSHISAVPSCLKQGEFHALAVTEEVVLSSFTLCVFNSNQHTLCTRHHAKSCAIILP